MHTETPAVAGPVERPVRPAVAVAHGSDEHLTLMGAPWHRNLLHGVDRADMLAFGRACMDAERERIRAANDAAIRAGVQEFQSGYKDSDPLADWRAFLSAVVGGPHAEAQYTDDQMRAYAAAAVATERQAAWDAVNKWILPGDLGGNGCDNNAQRNGMILASNVLMERMSGPNVEVEALAEGKSPRTTG